MLAVRLPKEIEQRLATLAERTGRTKTYYVREAVLAHLEDMEDYYLAAETYAEFVAGKEKAISSGELKVRLGLED